jgi:hypothetical protein
MQTALNDAVSTSQIHTASITKTNHLMVFRNIIVVSCENHMKHMTIQFFNTEVGGIYSYHFALKGGAVSFSILSVFCTVVSSNVTRTHNFQIFTFHLSSSSSSCPSFISLCALFIPIVCLPLAYLSISHNCACFLPRCLCYHCPVIILAYSCDNEPVHFTIRLSVRR